MKSHTNQRVRVLLSATEGSYGVLARSPIMVSEGLKPAQCRYKSRFPGRMHLQRTERKALSWSTARKSASIRSEVTIRKSQER